MHEKWMFGVTLMVACGLSQSESALGYEGGDSTLLEAHGDPAQLRPVLAARGSKPSLGERVSDLSDPVRVEEATIALERAGKKALPELRALARDTEDLAALGRAILLLEQIPGPEAEATLLEIQDDVQRSALVRTWAAAARLGRAETLDDVLGFAPLRSTFPALDRPLRQAVAARSEEMTDVYLGLRVIEADASLASLLAAPMLALGPEALVEGMTSAPTDGQRRIAAGLVATMGQTDPEMQWVVVEAMEFDPSGNPPWQGGALYVPSMNWSPQTAQALVGNLVTWYLFTYETGARGEAQKVRNNLMSVGLNRKAGLRRVTDDPIGLFVSWGDVVGTSGLRSILRELGWSDDARYVAALSAER